MHYSKGQELLERTWCWAWSLSGTEFPKALCREWSWSEGRPCSQPRSLYAAVENRTHRLVPASHLDSRNELIGLLFPGPIILSSKFMAVLILSPCLVYQCRRVGDPAPDPFWGLAHLFEGKASLLSLRDSSSRYLCLQREKEAHEEAHQLVPTGSHGSSGLQQRRRVLKDWGLQVLSSTQIYLWENRVGSSTNVSKTSSWFVNFSLTVTLRPLYCHTSGSLEGSCCP